MDRKISRVAALVARRRLAFAFAAASLAAAGTGLTSCNREESTTVAAGHVSFVNDCAHDLTFVSTGSPVGAKLGTLKAGVTKTIALSSFNQAAANPIMAYPNLTSAQCPTCDSWTALGGVPGTIQRQGWMWEGANASFARYCNPNLSGRNICAAQQNCCGPGMVQDGTFGTLFEITPKVATGGGFNDYLDLSTNYGSGPYSPPTLCGSPGAHANDCVTKAANIFYNIPVAWITNRNCSFTTKGIQVKSGRCLEPSCRDAYQHPTDDKQVTCPTSSGRGYEVRYCPGRS